MNQSVQTYRVTISALVCFKAMVRGSCRENNKVKTMSTISTIMQLQTTLSIHSTDNLPLHVYLYLKWKSR